MIEQVDVAQWVVVGCVVIGQIASWIKFNHNRAKSNISEEKEETATGTAIKMDIQSLKEDIQHPIYGLNALHKEMEGIRTHCAEVTGKFSQQIKNHDRRLDKVDK